jgi:hypothetical protein
LILPLLKYHSIYCTRDYNALYKKIFLKDLFKTEWWAAVLANKMQRELQFDGGGPHGAGFGGVRVVVVAEGRRGGLGQFRETKQQWLDFGCAGGNK